MTRWRRYRCAAVPRRPGGPGRPRRRSGCCPRRAHSWQMRGVDTSIDQPPHRRSRGCLTLFFLSISSQPSYPFCIPLLLLPLPPYPLTPLLSLTLTYLYIFPPYLLLPSPFTHSFLLFLSTFPSLLSTPLLFHLLILSLSFLPLLSSPSYFLPSIYILPYIYPFFLFLTFSFWLPLVSVDVVVGWWRVFILLDGYGRSVGVALWLAFHGRCCSSVLLDSVVCCQCIALLVVAFFS